MALTELELKKRRTRNDYAFHLEYRTRWSDNDMYAHLNNSIYAFLIDSIVNTYLISHCGLDPFSARSSTPSPSTSPLPTSTASVSSSPAPPSQIGLVVSSYCDYFTSVSFPDVLDLGLRVVKLGSSSVMYEVGIFCRGDEKVKAVGGFTHVFVEKKGMRPVSGGGAAKKGMDERIRRGLERLIIKDKVASAKL